MTQKVLDMIQEKIGYRFNEPQILVQAFTRKSFSEENWDWEDNEKLEFVGDKVLDFIVVKKLTEFYGFLEKSIARSLSSIRFGNDFNDDTFEKKNFIFTYSEGEMTEIKKQIVQTDFLSAAIDRLGFEEYLIMGNGDIKNNVQKEAHVKEDLLEAIVGAVAVDSRWNVNAIEAVVDKLLNLDSYIQSGDFESIDYVTYIHDWHRKEYGEEPVYEFANIGNDNLFECILCLKGYDVFEGFGYSKKASIKLAAKRAYLYLKEKNSRSKEVLDVIGSFDFESSVSKLQMLKEKKLIADVIYTFTENPPNEESNGNPVWSCRCEIPGVSEYVEYSDSKKMIAKKAAAYEILQILTVRNKMKELFLNYGTSMEDGKILAND